MNLLPGVLVLLLRMSMNSTPNLRRRGCCKQSYKVFHFSFFIVFSFHFLGVNSKNFFVSTNLQTNKKLKNEGSIQPRLPNNNKIDTPSFLRILFRVFVEASSANRKHFFSVDSVSSSIFSHNKKEERKVHHGGSSYSEIRRAC